MNPSGLDVFISAMDIAMNAEAKNDDAEGKGDGSRHWSKPQYWTQEEDDMLTEAVEMYGAKGWRLVSEYLGSRRTPDQCCQRWHRVLSPAINHSEWTKQEDETLSDGVARHGEGSWREVSRPLQGRTGQQCRYRWRHLKRVQAAAEKRRLQAQLRGKVGKGSHRGGPLLESVSRSSGGAEKPRSDAVAFPAPPTFSMASLTPIQPPLPVVSLAAMPPLASFPSASSGSTPLSNSSSFTNLFSMARSHPNSHSHSHSHSNSNSNSVSVPNSNSNSHSNPTSNSNSNSTSSSSSKAKMTIAEGAPTHKDSSPSHNPMPHQNRMSFDWLLN